MYKLPRFICSGEKSKQLVIVIKRQKSGKFGDIKSPLQHHKCRLLHPSRPRRSLCQNEPI